MKNSYLFASEMDQLAENCQKEISLLNKTNVNHELIEYLKTIKKKLGLLAINITLSINADQENNIIEELINAIDKIITSNTNNSLMISTDSLTYGQFSQKIVELINHYQVEKLTPVNSTSINSTISKFNEATRVFAYSSPSKKIKTVFLSKKTVILNFNN